MSLVSSPGCPAGDKNHNKQTALEQIDFVWLGPCMCDAPLVWLVERTIFCPGLLGPEGGFKVETWGAHELIYDAEMEIPLGFCQPVCCQTG